jgi:hypothetical protein
MGNPGFLDVQPTNMKKHLFGVFTLIYLSCNDPAYVSKEQAAQIEKDRQAEVEKYSRRQNGIKKTKAELPKWKYSQEADKMTSDSIYFESVNANDLLDLKFPYNGGVVARLIIRNMRGENDAMLRLSSGQFNKSIDGYRVKARFDNKKMKTLYCSGSSDGDNSYVFLNYAHSFISKVKKSKHLIIEAELYDNGIQQMKFNITGLNWRH